MSSGGWTIAEACAEFERAGLPVDPARFRMVIRALPGFRPVLPVTTVHTWTVEEACAELAKTGIPIEPARLRLIIKGLAWQPAGWRRTGKPGHPGPVYPIADFQHLHRDIAHWLTRAVNVKTDATR